MTAAEFDPKNNAGAMRGPSMPDLHVATYSIPATHDGPGIISPSIEAICGYSALELSKDPSIWRHWIHPDDQEFVADYFAGIAPGQHYDLCYRIIHRDGFAVPIRDTGYFRSGSEQEGGGYTGLIWQVGFSFLSLLTGGESLALDDSLAKAIPDLWLVFDREGKILHCKPGTEVQPVRPAQEIVGLPVSEVLPPELAKVVEENVAAGEVRLHEYSLDCGLEGTRWFEARFSPIGKNRCLVITRDVTKRWRASKALENRNAILGAMSACAQRFLQQPIQLDVFDFVRRIGSAAGVDRCFVFQNRVDPDSGQLLFWQIAEWCRPGVRPQMDNEQLQGSAYEEAGFGDLARRMAAGEVLSINPQEVPEPARSILIEQDIITLVLAPIFVDGQWWGFLGFDECFYRREWEQSDKDTLAGASALFGLTLQQQRQQQELIEREDKFRTVFENVPTPILLTDSASKHILEANQAASDSFPQLASFAPGKARFTDIFAASDVPQDASRDGAVCWVGTGSQTHPYRLSSNQLQLAEGTRTAWFFQSLQEAFDREREALSHTALLASLAKVNSRIAEEPTSPDCAFKLIHALVDSGLIAAAAAIPIAETDGALAQCMMANCPPTINSLIAMSRIQDAVRALLSNPDYARQLQDGLGLRLEGAECQQWNLPLLSPGNPLLVYPVNRHNQLFALLVVEWDSTTGFMPGNAPLMNFAVSFSRCAESHRVAVFNQAMKSISAAAASAESLSTLLHLACEATLSEADALCVVGFLRKNPETNAYRVCLKTSQDFSATDTLPHTIDFSTAVGPSPWWTAIDSWVSDVDPQGAKWVSERIVLDESYTVDLYVLWREGAGTNSWIGYVLSNLAELVVMGFRALNARNVSKLAESKLESMVQFAAVIQVRVNSEGLLVWLNSYARQRLDSAGIEIVPGDSLFRLLSEADQDLLRFALAAAAMNPKIPLCLEFARGGTESLVIEGYLSAVDDGGQVMEWVGLDVSEQRTSRINLLLLQECFRQTHSPTAITRLDNGSCVIADANEAFLEQLAGARAWEEIRGDSMADLLGQKASLVQGLAKLQGSGMDQIYVETLKGWFDVLVTPVSVEWSTNVHHVWIFSDISKQKQITTNLAKALLHEQEAHAVKSRLIATSSHEFRTPLAVISSSVDLLERYSSKTAPERDQALWKKIRNSVNRMAEMIERVLEVEKTNPLSTPEELVPVVLQQVAADVMAELAAAFPHARPMQWEAPPDPVWVLDDGQSLRLIFSNLLLNARKYSSPEGRVGLRIEVQSQMVSIVISDEGIGIPKADLPGIFDPFSRGSNTNQIPGTGVGLSIVKHCMKKLQGTIDLDSIEGSGTTVRLQLKRAVPSPPDRGEKDSSADT